MTQQGVFTQEKHKYTSTQKTCTWMLRAGLYLIAQREKNPKIYQRMKGEINCGVYIYIKEYYSIIKRIVFLIHAIWVNLKNIMPKRSQTQENMLWFHIHETLVKTSLIYSDRKQISNCWQGKWRDDHKGTFWGKTVFCILIVLVVTQVKTC